MLKLTTLTHISNVHLIRYKKKNDTKNGVNRKLTEEKPTNKFIKLKKKKKERKKKGKKRLRDSVSETKKKKKSWQYPQAIVFCTLLSLGTRGGLEGGY